MQDRSFPFGARASRIGGVLTHQSFSIVAARHRTELQRHCARLLGPTAETEDALQETLLRAWRSRQTLGDRAAARPWLYRIATNVCFDLLAERRAAPASLDGEDGEPPVAPREQQPDAVVIANETVELAVLTAIRHLPARQHASLVMRDVLRWSACDTASALSLSVAATNSAVQRARSALRAHLGTGRLDWACAAPCPHERRALDHYLEAVA
jgi:RNA polymerase sigma factor (sigma-70 family)